MSRKRERGRSKLLLVLLILIVLAVAAYSIHWYSTPRPGHVLDEALLVGRDASSFPAADVDYFHDMDGGIQLEPPEIQGRDTWIVWTAGNDRLWNQLIYNSAGALDFLKTLSSSHPNLPKNLGRDTRWQYLGLVNDPCFEKATGPDPQRWGLWLDKRRADCQPDPFEDEKKYRGVQIGARGKTVGPNGEKLEVGSFYGYETGIVGMRLFPNPDFDDKAAQHWCDGGCGVKYYSDASYYNDKKLVRPYRVGMSCGFCHVGPNPLKPPKDPNNPKWENLSSNVGAQYFWIDRIFYWEADQSNFVWQLFHTSRPGSLDTSFVSTDNINNPRTMNAVYMLRERLDNALRWGKEIRPVGGNGRRRGRASRTAGGSSGLARAGRPPTGTASARRWAPGRGTRRTSACRCRTACSASARSGTGRSAPGKSLPRAAPARRPRQAGGSRR